MHISSFVFRQVRPNFVYRIQAQAKGVRKINPFRMKHFLMMMIVAALLLACSNKPRVVDFKETDNYFYAGKVQHPTLLKITTQADFDKHFGIVAFMGDGGKATEIDFSKQFVVAKVLPETDTLDDLKPVALTQESGKLHLTSTVKHVERRDYTIQPCFILIVDRKYVDDELTE